MLDWHPSGMLVVYEMLLKGCPNTPNIPKECQTSDTNLKQTYGLLGL